MLVNGSTLRTLLEKAQAGGYAVPAFNYSDIWDMRAIVDAAEAESAPILLASIPKVVNALGVGMCGAIGAAATARAQVPVVHHLDHSASLDLCKAAIDAGYPSVMIDASMHPLDENIRIVKQVVEYARRKGVAVEAEIGRIPASKDEGTPGGEQALVDPEEAARLVEACAVDALAVGIGTAHGFYKGKPHIDFERLARVHELVSVPLVLHGGTGIPEEDVRRAIKNGIAKVNVGTIIRHTYLTSLRDELKDMERAAHTVDIQEAIRPRIVAVVREWIGSCMAGGRA